MILSITTFLALRACLKGTGLDKVNLFSTVSVGDLTDKWVTTLGQKAGVDAVQAVGDLFCRLNGPGGILPLGDDLAAAERRALGTVLTAFHLQLTEQHESLTLPERQFHLILGDLAQDLRADSEDGQRAYQRLIKHQRSNEAVGSAPIARLLESATPEGSPPTPDLSAAVHTASLAWLVEEVRLRATRAPTSATATPRPPASPAEAHPAATTATACPEALRAWMLEAEGFRCHSARVGDWFRRHLLRRPPVQRPLIQGSFLQLWAACLLEQIKTTPRAFNQHMAASLAALKAGQPAQVQAFEAAAARLESAVTTTLGGIQERLSSLLGLTEESFRTLSSDLASQGTETHRLLADLLTGQAEQNTAWQAVERYLQEILTHLHEVHGPPLDTFADHRTPSTNTDPGEHLSQLVYRYRWLPHLLSRETEMQQLLHFLDSDAPYAIHVLVGEAGTGKSRLALELVLRAQDAGWQAGFLRSGFKLAELDHIHQWQPGRSTLLVIDYASEHGSQLARVLARITEQEARFTGRLRVLLIDRPAALATHLNDNLSLGGAISQDRSKEQLRQRLHHRHGLPAEATTAPYQELPDALQLEPLGGGLVA